MSELENLLLFQDIGHHVLRYLPSGTIASLSSVCSTLRVSPFIHQALLHQYCVALLLTCRTSVGFHRQLRSRLERQMLPLWDHVAGRLAGLQLP